MSRSGAAWEQMLRQGGLRAAQLDKLSRNGFLIVHSNSTDTRKHLVSIKSPLREHMEMVLKPHRLSFKQLCVRFEKWKKYFVSLEFEIRCLSRRAVIADGDRGLGFGARMRGERAGMNAGSS